MFFISMIQSRIFMLAHAPVQSEFSKPTINVIMFALIYRLNSHLSYGFDSNDFLRYNFFPFAYGSKRSLKKYFITM